MQATGACKDRAGAARRCAAAMCAAFVLTAGAQRADREVVADRVKGITRDAVWRPIARTPLGFSAHHPQGMVKIGDALFVSSVEIKTRTRRFPEPVGRYDRDAGAGVGHLFKLNAAGSLIADLKLGEGSIYHPGGIDWDGRYIWVPVAEYRPNSRSIVYRVDPRTLEVAEVLRVEDHLGAIVRNSDDNTLHAVSWGSRRFYRWTLDGGGRVTDARTSGRPTRNTSHYVDYQDCKYAGAARMLCTGVTEIREPDRAEPFRLGGLELVNLADGRPEHQVPVLLWTPDGLAMTQNPSWFEPTAAGLRAYFLPGDGRSTLYVYEVDAPR